MEYIKDLLEVELSNSDMVKCVIPGDHNFDSGMQKVRFGGMRNFSISKDAQVSFRIKNVLKNDSVHTGDLALVTVRTTPENRYPVAIIDTVCVDNLTCPDDHEELHPDQKASKQIILASHNDNFKDQIAQIGGREGLDFPVTYGRTLDEPVIYQEGGIPTCPSFFVDNKEGHHAKGYIRKNLMGWMVDSLKALPTENSAIHHFAGVYAINHVEIDFSQKRIYWATICSGDVEHYEMPIIDPTLRPDRFNFLYPGNNQSMTGNRAGEKPRHRDLVWPVDKYAKLSGVSGAERYLHKVYQVYDVVGPLSGEKVGPFTLTMGKQKGNMDFLSMTDGYKKFDFETGVAGDDATSIELFVRA